MRVKITNRALSAVTVRGTIPLTSADALLVQFCTQDTLENSLTKVLFRVMTTMEITSGTLNFSNILKLQLGKNSYSLLAYCLRHGSVDSSYDVGRESTVSQRRHFETYGSCDDRNRHDFRDNAYRNFTAEVIFRLPKGSQVHTTSNPSSSVVSLGSMQTSRDSAHKFQNLRICSLIFDSMIATIYANPTGV